MSGLLCSLAGLQAPRRSGPCWWEATKDLGAATKPALKRGDCPQGTRRLDSSHCHLGSWSCLLDREHDGIKPSSLCSPPHRLRTCGERFPYLPQQSFFLKFAVLHFSQLHGFGLKHRFGIEKAPLVFSCFQENMRLELPQHCVWLKFQQEEEGITRGQCNAAITTNHAAANITLRFPLNTPHISFRKGIKTVG